MTDVLATPGCPCATCEYIRATAGQTVPLFPIVNPVMPRPMVPTPIFGPYRCACGVDVYSHQVHTCEYSGFRSSWSGHTS